ncbi:MAG: class II D-tagatose-bisphosphate aldolase, non-catalytic subunit [Mangrovibacterium sp.]|nr:class II D-tagatose-bisphosphate aldolase, non-catalytic subunit [Mangrovibacterium sp.]
MKHANTTFLEILSDNREGHPVGIYSVCSANADVLASSFKQAKADESILLVESTSNQVDQFGGYTGMKPSDFVRYIRRLAGKEGFPENRVLLGGDHLGPNAWQSLRSEEAMNHARVLIREYVKEGYLKIHLDTSMFCADDQGDRKKPLSDEVVAERTTALCQVAENTWNTHRQGFPKPVYVIGTEVPVPGGAREEEDEVVPTTPEDAARTIETIKRSFLKAGLQEAWERVVACVVQPGVEFGDDQVFQYRQEKANGLSRKIMEFDHLVFEAHSTDYQTEANLKKLVEDHFCILKVGPWLTFAYREALFALEAMETEILGHVNPERSGLRETLEQAMISEPKYWQKYYPGDEKQQSFKRKYSFSDRLRYYWPLAELESARKKLLENLRKNRIPASLLSQFMPIQFYQVCDGSLSTDPLELVHSYIQIVTGIYSRACGLSKNNLYSRTAP